MLRKSIWSLGEGVRILDAQQIDGQWLISAMAMGSGACPDCVKRSIHRHGWHERYLQDLPAQGAPATVKLRLQRWQCRNGACKRKTFTTQLPEVVAPRARRTARATEVVYLFGHGVGGRPGERLIKRIGMPMSDDTILRCLKRRVKARGSESRTITKWIRANTLPERSASAPKTTSPRHFEDYLSRRWSEGCVRGRRLFQEIKARGYTGSFSNLERLLAKWRNPKSKTVNLKATSAVPNSTTCRSRDGTFDIANRGCGAVHQAAGNADRQSSCQSRCAEKGLARVRHHASNSPCDLGAC